MKLNKFNISILFVLAFFVSCANTMEINILHTNDTHSQVEQNQNDLGGYARRMGVIDSIRRTEKNVLLFDAGDFCQGTPYFNFYHGRIEIDALNKMRYDAATLGNHEFDNGIDTLAAILQLADFQIVCANYDFSNTELNRIVKPYIVLNRFDVRIGVFGLMVNLEGLVMERNYAGAIFHNPIEAATQTVDILKNTENCNVIICLSHLGITDDLQLAAQTKDIDVIIGGHSHTLTEDNLTVENVVGKKVLISQMGKSGLYLGKIDLTLKRKQFF